MHQLFKKKHHQPRRRRSMSNLNNRLRLRQIKFRLQRRMLQFQNQSKMMRVAARTQAIKISPNNSLNLDLKALPSVELSRENKPHLKPKRLSKKLLLKRLNLLS